MTDVIEQTPADTSAPAAATPAPSPVEQHAAPAQAPQADTTPTLAPPPSTAPVAPPPMKAEDYKAELPQDFKLAEGQSMPPGYEFNQNDERLIAFRKVATEAGLSQKQFSAMLGIEAASVAKGQAILQARDKALGENAAGRLNELATWLDGSFDKETAYQLKGVLWSGKMVKAFETMKSAITNQGVGRFNSSGREAPDASDGRPAGWDTSSNIDKLTWFRQQQRN